MQKLREISFLLRSYLQEVDMEVVDPAANSSFIIKMRALLDQGKVSQDAVDEVTDLINCHAPKPSNRKKASQLISSNEDGTYTVDKEAMDKMIRSLPQYAGKYRSYSEIEEGL